MSLLLVERRKVDESLRVAKPPKPRGKSPGWETGQPRQPRITYPIIRKRTFKPCKQAVKSA